MNAAMFAVFNGWEIVMVLVLALVLFGAKKLPELAKGLGQGIREFKKASREVTDEFQNVMDEDPAPAPQRKIKDKEKLPTTPNTVAQTDEEPSKGQTPA